MGGSPGIGAGRAGRARRSGGGGSAEEARAPQERLSGGISSSQAPYPSPRRCGLHIPRRRLRRLRAHSIAAPLPGANTSLVCAGSPFPSGTGSLIPLLLLFPPQTLRLLCGGSPIFPPVTPLKRPKEGGLRPPAFGIPPRGGRRTGAGGHVGPPLRGYREGQQTRGNGRGRSPALTRSPEVSAAGRCGHRPLRRGRGRIAASACGLLAMTGVFCHSEERSDVGIRSFPSRVQFPTR